MIFINRKRFIQNKEDTKDPKKYWYVEKHVYGMLKETVEIPLNTNTKFTAIESGYEDDEFYGWSINNTSVTRQFNSSNSYSNTAAAVKNNLDSENTLKIYAVYKYHPPVSSVTKTNTGSYTLIAKETGKITITGAVRIRTLILDKGTTVSDTISSGTISIKITDNKNNIKNTLSVGGTSISSDIEIGDKITFSITTQQSLPSGSSGPPTGTYISYDSTITIQHTGLMYDMNVFKYRVESHI